MSSPVPSPGPAAITSVVASRISASAPSTSSVPVDLGQRQRHELGPIDAMIGTAEAGAATVTSPAPERSAAIAAR